MLHPTRNTLYENVRARSVDLLTENLVAAIDLHAQVKQAHWSIRGPGLIGLHDLFNRVAGEVEDWSDLLAKRAPALGGTGHGTIQVAAERSYLLRDSLGVASGAE